MSAAVFDSPIEFKFADALVDHLDDPFDSPLTIQPQAQIGPFRVDFLLTWVDDSCAVRLVVECDGHDFHDRTKEQASRDRERDRMLLAAGFPVIRFTGSELHRGADSCAQDTLMVLAGLRRPNWQWLVPA